jgi:hypothetical protein
MITILTTLALADRNARSASSTFYCTRSRANQNDPLPELQVRFQYRQPIRSKWILPTPAEKELSNNGCVLGSCSRHSHHSSWENIKSNLRVIRSMRRKSIVVKGNWRARSLFRARENGPAAPAGITYTSAGLRYWKRTRSASTVPT